MKFEMFFFVTQAKDLGHKLVKPYLITRQRVSHLGVRKVACYHFRYELLRKCRWPLAAHRRQLKRWNRRPKAKDERRLLSL